MEGNCEYIEYAVADSRQGVVLQFGELGEVLITHYRKKWYSQETYTHASDLE